jgi:DNA modification methylase
MGKQELRLPDPDRRLEARSVDSLIPYARNARTHSDAQIAQIAASIREFGWTNPILVDEQDGIIAGHGRLLAARKLGMGAVPVIVLSGLSAAQKRALVLADNKLALNAGWDDELLRLELSDLKSDGFDLDLIGFSTDEITALLAERTDGLTDPDDAPEPEAEAVSALGDVWVLGRHRLICGDSTDAAVVDKVLAGVKPHLMVTDPPYGVEYDPAWRDEAAKYSPSMGNRKDTAKGRVSNDDRADWREAWVLFPGDVAYVWCASLCNDEVIISLEASGFQRRAQIIWAKSHITVGRGHYQWQHEPCWYAVRKGATGHWFGDRKQSTLWQISKPQKSETGHSTQKPIECMKRPIENNSSPGQALYEPFSGSGTTIIAAEMTGRCCHAIELNPQYVDVAVRRWQNFTGQQAILESNGRSFADIEAAHRAPTLAAE